jgi:drug/metabolite transporter (DMT)-like permease
MVNIVVIPALTVAALTALQVIIQKHAVKSLSHRMILVVSSVIYFALTLLYIGWHSEHLSTELRGLAVPVVLAILAATVFGFLANILYFSLIHHGEISVITALTSTVPIFVAALAVLIVKESVGLKQIAGIGAIVGGTILLS